MARFNLLVVRIVALSALYTAGCQEVLAQGFIKKDQDLPNASSFYMARQQITITDDGPIINDKRTGPGVAAGSGGNGGMAGGRLPLPKAGWQPYSSEIPSVRTALPQVNNGVPKLPAVAPGANGAKARAGNLRIHSTPSASAPHTVKTYQSYKGYGGSLPTAAGTAHSAAGTASYNSSTAVKGDILHWARTHH